MALFIYAKFLNTHFTRTRIIPYLTALFIFFFLNKYVVLSLRFRYKYS